MAGWLPKLLFAGASALFWEEVVRPELATGDAKVQARRRGDPRPVVQHRGTTLPLPYASDSLAAIVLVDSVERSADPLVLIGDAARVAERVYVLAPHLWTPGAWLDPRNRWIKVGEKLYAVPGRKAAPVSLETVASDLGHLTPLETAWTAVEEGVAGWLSSQSGRSGGDVLKPKHTSQA